MVHSKLTNEMAKNFLKQLTILEEERIPFLDTYFPMHGNERIRMDQFLTDYVQTLRAFLAQPKAFTPTVLIGSEVSLTYLDEQTTDSLTIVFPHETQPDQQQISFLSPIGRQLLMKKIGDVINIEIPSGLLPVRIDQIQYISLSSYQDILEA